MKTSKSPRRVFQLSQKAAARLPRVESIRKVFDAVLALALQGKHDQAAARFRAVGAGLLEPVP